MLKKHTTDDSVMVLDHESHAEKIIQIMQRLRDEDGNILIIKYSIGRIFYCIF